MTLPKEHVSPSQLSTYMRCPAMYYLRYIEGLVIPPQYALTRGKVVHLGQEFNYRQKMDSGRDIPLSDLQEYVASEFEEHAEKTDFGDKDLGKCKDETISLASLYHTEIAPTVNPVEVEKKLTVEFDNTDYKLLCIIDLIDDQGRIRDTKTTARTPGVLEVVKSLQLTAYSFTYRQNYGQEESGVQLDYLVSTKKPKVVCLRGKRTEKDIERFLNTMAHVVKCIENEIFYPNPNNQLCNPKACGFWSTCREVF